MLNLINKTLFTFVKTALIQSKVPLFNNYYLSVPDNAYLDQNILHSEFFPMLVPTYTHAIPNLTSIYFCFTVCKRSDNNAFQDNLFYNTNSVIALNDTLEKVRRVNQVLNDTNSSYYNATYNRTLTVAQVSCNAITINHREQLIQYYKNTYHCEIFEEAEQYMIQSPNHFVKVLYNLENNLIIFFSNKCNDTYYDLLSYVTNRVFATNPYTDTELTAYMHKDFASITNEVTASFAEAMKKYYDESYKRMCDRFKEVFAEHNASVINYQTDINDIQVRIQNTLANLNTLYDELNQKQMLLFRLQTEGSTSQTELFNYLTQYDTKSILGVVNSTSYMRIYIRTVLTIWDKDDYIALRNARTTYHNALSDLSDTMIAFLNAILDTGEIKISFLNTVKFSDFRNGTFEYCGCSRNITGLLANPHQAQYDCWGDNAPLLNKAIRIKDYTGFWLQLKATLSTLRITDNPVFSHLIAWIQEATQYAPYSTGLAPENENNSATIKQAYYQDKWMSVKDCYQLFCAQLGGQNNG